MPKMVTLTIDQQTVTVPQGTLIVDAAKKIGNNIPVFCYHPKMEPVGMCRMCLVEIGRPIIDRATGQPILNEDGTPQIQFGPKLDTACTTPVTEGMVVNTATPAVTDARKEMLEFILTSHPLDCPVCDKGGECPLQNLTMKHGPGESRFLFDEKSHAAKHVPLGELIYLDRERCIQCGRCVRFQESLAGDAVIGFYNRGRRLEIVSFSEPGFDSIFSGNTTDICPVGALTTADFRFGARPWELTPAASLCTHCAVSCNLTYNVRREAVSGGGWAIKRVMPRQNEQVNEIWMCDKGRFGYHYAESSERLSQPLVRVDGELQPAVWEEALDLAASRLKEAANPLLLAGGRLSVEDCYNLQALVRSRGGQTLLDSHLGGGELVSAYAPGEGFNFSSLGAGSAILVIASDLHQEAPIWWLRIKAAVARGATLIAANARPTRLDDFAAHRLRYPYGGAAQLLAGLLPGAEAAAEVRAAAEALQSAENLLVIYGGEGLDLAGSAALAGAGAALLEATGKVGHAQSGLLAVWERANDQGAWELGCRPQADLAGALAAADVLYLAGSDPAGDDPRLAQAVDAAGFVIVQELFISATAQRADIVFPVLAYTEREGTLVNGERRVQRYYPALRPRAGLRADYAVAAQIGQRLGLPLPDRAAALVFQRAAAEFPAFAGLTYQRLAETPEQWPIIGRSGLYFGGTGYDNHQGIGVKLTPAEKPAAETYPSAAPTFLAEDEVLLVPVTRLYDRGTTLLPAKLLHKRLAEPVLHIHPHTAARLGLVEGGRVQLTAGWTAEAGLCLDETVPEGVALLPRSTGIPAAVPQAVKIQNLARVPEA